MGQHRSLRALQGVLVLVTLSACGSDDSAERPIDSTPSAVSAVTPPPTDGGFDYQLGGAYPPPDGVTVVERDSTADPVDGTYSICYVNGFQTQPGVDWPRDLLVPGDDGNPLVDPGWPDEHLLDLSTPAQRDAAAARQQNTIDECARRGFRAVEFDNLDSYSRSRGAFTLDDAVAFATDLTTRAHRARLAVAQKNTADLESRGRDEVGFDFAVTEECDRFDECDSYTAVYGGQVLDIEYSDDLRGSVADICARSATPAMTVVRDRELVARGDPGYRYASC